MNPTYIILGVIGYFLFKEDVPYKYRPSSQYRRARNKASRYYYYRVKNRKYYNRDYSAK